jgi:hypothetical protein
MGFLDVPVEIIALIMECIDLDDVFSLSLTCRQFGQLVRSQTLSRVALKVRSLACPLSQGNKRMSHLTRLYMV